MCGFGLKKIWITVKFRNWDWGCSLLPQLSIETILVQFNWSSFGFLSIQRSKDILQLQSFQILFSKARKCLQNFVFSFYNLPLCWGREERGANMLTTTLAARRRARENRKFLWISSLAPIFSMMWINLNWQAAVPAFCHNSLMLRYCHCSAWWQLDQTFIFFVSQLFITIPLTSGVIQRIGDICQPSPSIYL